MLNKNEIRKRAQQTANAKAANAMKKTFGYCFFIVIKPYKLGVVAIIFSFHHPLVGEYDITFLFRKHQIVKNYFLLLLVSFHDWSHLVRYQK